jgi:beta-glucosidase
MSDWGAVYAADFATQGLDQESGEQLDQQVWFKGPLREAVQSGQVPQGRLEDMTRRILHSMFASGLFDNPVEKADVDYAAHGAIARNEANEGIVLLKNRQNALPLRAAAIHRILVVGGRAYLGTLSGGGSSQVFPPHTDPRTVIPVGTSGGEMADWRSMVFQSTAPLAAIRARAPNATVTFDDGGYPSAAAARAKQADVVVVFAAQWTTESEDVPELSLPSGQDALIQAVTAANPNTVVVLETGGPVTMPWLDQSAAVLEAWYPGAGGADAIADVLFGVVNPSGRLPITFPTAAGPLPGFGLPRQESFDVPHPQGAAVGYRQAGQKALFPFGYGLSYTHFVYSDLQVAREKAAVTVSFTVRNDGAVAGKDAPQIYLTSMAGEAVRRLVGFAKVDLVAGADKRVSVAVDSRLLSHFDAGKQRWHVAAGKYRVEVGASAADGELHGVVTLGESWRKP